MFPFWISLSVWSGMALKSTSNQIIDTIFVWVQLNETLIITEKLITEKVGNKQTKVHYFSIRKKSEKLYKQNLWKVRFIQKSSLKNIQVPRV